MNVHTDIKRIQKRLSAKVIKKGVYEDFGQAEVRFLEDKYTVWDLPTSRSASDAIRIFSSWCMNYTGS